MIYSTTKTILRRFMKTKGWFFINLFGLSTGLLCSIILYLWIKSEREVDSFHGKEANLYKVYKTHEFADRIQSFDWTPSPLAPTLVEQIPEVQEGTSILQLGEGRVYREGGGTRNELRVKEYYARENFFDIFSYELLLGDRYSVLSDPRSVVLSEELATKLFGTTHDVIGKTIMWNQGENDETFTVSGIFKTVEQNSSLEFDMLLPFEHILKTDPSLRNWDNADPLTFIVLNPGTDIKQLNNKMTAIINDKIQDDQSKLTLSAHKFSDLYLNGNFENGKQSGGRIVYIRIFFIVTLFILFIACINFTNLTTAMATTRVKEVGIKKAMGITRRELIIQFLTESLVLTTLSFLLAIVFAVLTLPFISQVLGKELVLTPDPVLLLYGVGVIVLTSLLAGIYPSLYISGFNPVSLLRGKLSLVNKSWLRQGLVIVQFSISIILIVSMIVLNTQMDFIFQKDLGYSRDNIIEFEVDGNIEKNAKTFLEEVRNIPGVVNASIAGHNLLGENGSTWNVVWEGKAPEDKTTFKYLNGGYDFLETMGIQLVQGRSYSEDYGADYENVVINETAAKVMGLENPVGKTLTIWRAPRKIIGVVKDFHLDSFYEKVQPCFINLSGRAKLAFIKVSGSSEGETIARIESFYKKYNNGLPFDYTYFDQSYKNVYKLENRITSISWYATIIAIVISCLGLYSLAAFFISRKRKEIAIRKTLGSSNSSIFLRLAISLTLSVMIALVIALPVSFFLARNWLNTFSYRIDLQAWFFILAGVSALAIAWGTISYTVLKGSRINPADVLRQE